MTFNRNEQIAILALTAALLVGSVVSAWDYFWPSDIPDFEVHKGAVPVPEIVDPAESTPADASPVPPQDDTPVNVNTAGAEELARLPRIGPVTAARIVAHRETHGPFPSPEALTDVKGIGPKTLAGLRDRIVLTGP